MNSWGNMLRISLFGESHGKAVGGVLDGLRAGIELDFAQIEQDLGRRRPRTAAYSTQRRENDEYELISGVTNGITNGAPLTVMFKNKDVKRDDYKPQIARPSHADFAAYIKHNGFCDLSGGGHFSARLTAPLVFFGAIARTELRKQGIEVFSHIKSIGDVEDDSFNPVSPQKNDFELDFPLIDKSKRKAMEELLSEVKSEGDSIGGVVECAATGAPAGLGEPFFDSVESCLAHLLFSIPAVKGVEFGAGFALAKMRGSIANDRFTENPTNKYGVSTHTNNAGGITGGLTNAMPIIFRAAFKPIPSIAKQQSGIDLQAMKPVSAKAEGRHDVCAALRGAVIVEAVACICIYDFILREKQ